MRKKIPTCSNSALTKNIDFFNIFLFFFSRIRRVDDIREKSVFSELIGGQRQEENPGAETEIDDETSIDTGLIGDDNEDDVEVRIILNTVGF